MAGPFGAVCFEAVSTLPAAEISQALSRFQLLAFRDQRLDPESFTELAARLGEPAHYPYADALREAPFVVPIVKTEADEHNFGGAWHSDSTYLARPPATTLLLACKVPARGGDTLFASASAAYQNLSAGLKRTLRRLDAVNTSALVHAASGVHASVAGDSRSDRNDAQTEAVHPVVRVDPISGRSALFLSLVHSDRFSGMTRAESLPLLEFLQARITAPENCVRLQWQPGTLAIWDNRSLQHLPLNDYPGMRREMHRIILAGEQPQGVRDRA